MRGGVPRSKAIFVRVGEKLSYLEYVQHNVFEKQAENCLNTAITRCVKYKFAFSYIFRLFRVICRLNLGRCVYIYIYCNAVKYEISLVISW
jgi:hypothetical protein